MTTDTTHHPLPVTATDEQRDRHYAAIRPGIDALLANEDDWIAAMATVSCELHRAFDYYHWTGFYRHCRERELVVGPYRGGHGCLRISFDRGVCGAAAREKTTQRVEDVNGFAGHIACSSSTLSELVVPVLTPAGEVLAVLDVDSDHPSAFTEVDQRHIESLCATLGERFADTTVR